MPIPLRGGFDAPGLRALARQRRDAAQARRLLALALVYEGATRSAAAQTGGVSVQIIRDCVVTFNAHGPAGLIDRKHPPGCCSDRYRRQDARGGGCAGAGPRRAGAQLRKLPRRFAASGRLVRTLRCAGRRQRRSMAAAVARIRTAAAQLSAQG